MYKVLWEVYVMVFLFLGKQWGKTKELWGKGSSILLFLTSAFAAVIHTWYVPGIVRGTGNSVSRIVSVQAVGQGSGRGLP